VAFARNTHDALRTGAAAAAHDALLLVSPPSPVSPGLPPAFPPTPKARDEDGVFGGGGGAWHSASPPPLPLPLPLLLPLLLLLLLLMPTDSSERIGQKKGLSCKSLSPPPPLISCPSPCWCPPSNEGSTPSAPSNDRPLPSPPPPPFGVPLPRVWNWLRALPADRCWP
jgi:hypothetical protein